MSKKNPNLLRNILAIVAGIATFAALVVVFCIILAISWGPDGPNMDRAFRSFLPFLIVGACIAIVLTVGLKALKKQQKK